MRNSLRPPQDADTTLVTVTFPEDERDTSLVLRARDPDPGVVLQFASLDTSSNVSVSLNGNRVSFDPKADYFGSEIRRFRVADPGTWDQVLDEARRQSMADFDLARPLWRLTLLEGLEGGRAALIIKLHHAIADGQGAMMLGATVIDLMPGDQDLGPMPAAPVAAPMDSAAFVGTAVADASSYLMRQAKEAADAALPFASRALTDPVGALEDIVNVVKSVSRFVALPSRPMSPVMTGRSINYHFVTFDVPMAELKAAAKAHGLSLNDAFMAGVTGGLRIYHERLDEPVATLRCNMPISLRNPERPAQNAVTIARFEVPVGIKDSEIHNDILEGGCSMVCDPCIKRIGRGRIFTSIDENIGSAYREGWFIYDIDRCGTHCFMAESVLRRHVEVIAAIGDIRDGHFTKEKIVLLWIFHGL